MTALMLIVRQPGALSPHPEGWYLFTVAALVSAANLLPHGIQS